MNTSKTTVAVIGLGNIGKAIARNLVKGNHSVILATRDIEKTKSFAKQLGKLASTNEIAAAIKEAEVIIPAIYFNALKDFFQTYSKELDGKIITEPIQQQRARTENPFAFKACGQ